MYTLGTRHILWLSCHNYSSRLVYAPIYKRGNGGSEKFGVLPAVPKWVAQPLDSAVMTSLQLLSRAGHSL